MEPKEILLKQLQNSKNNWILGLAAISLFADDRVFPFLENNHVKFGIYEIRFKLVKTLLEKPADREIALNEFMKSLLRAFIKESFELIKVYCKETSQVPKFETELWYEFARIIRNSLAHNFMLNFNNNYKKNVLPVSWRGLVIDASMDGSELGMGFFGAPQAWEMFTEYENFVKDKLT